MDRHKSGSTEPLLPALKKHLSKSQYDLPSSLPSKTIVTKKGKVLSVVPKNFIPPRPHCVNESDQKDINTVSLKKNTPLSEQPLSIWFNQENSISLDQIIIEEKRKKRQLKMNAAQKVEPKNGVPLKRWQIPELAICQPDLKEIMRQQKSIHFHQNKSLITINKPIIATSSEKIAQNQQLIKHLLYLWQFHEIPMKSTYEFKAIDLSSDEFSYIQTLFNNTMQSYTMTSIERVVNPYLLLSYHLKKATHNKYQEKLLFHGTKIENIDSICIDNFDWRLVYKHKYGKGVSFSTTPCYARHYQDPLGDNKVMFAAKVLVGWTLTGQNNTKLPQEPYDTTTDKNQRVYVKYDDSSFYPAYLIYYQEK
ncbi:protein mono-ADP-ribosyltransferase TIPARP-like [Euwallacea similis]|uniref:protein mono-ADP-ribosyltransferase TIPARP-like n=1 Tax=Euwallacea similis TaxID=1736056 RepID=UPI00344EC036